MIKSYSFLPEPYTLAIAKGIYRLDQYIRQDICEGCIQNEVDYVSTLMAYIRLFFRSQKLARQIGGFKIDISKGTSQVLSRSLEQKFGCDALIIFRARNKAKVCMFEAKYPKIKSYGYWDWHQDDKNYTNWQKQQISHFHHQLKRQEKWDKAAFIWELFINDCYPSNSLNFLDNYGSTCIWHKDAYAYSQDYIGDEYNYKTKKTELWNNRHLKDCLERLPYKPLNLEKILTTVLSKHEDKEIRINDDLISLKSEDEEEINIPLTIDSIKEHQSIILEKMGVREFIFIELNL